MSIVICAKCDRRIDMDFEEVFDIEDFLMICEDCEDKMRMLWQVMLEQNKDSDWGCLCLDAGFKNTEIYTWSKTEKIKRVKKYYQSVYGLPKGV